MTPAQRETQVRLNSALATVGEGPVSLPAGQRYARALDLQRALDSVLGPEPEHCSMRAFGELGLDGRIKPARGLFAALQGTDNAWIVPEAQAGEAAYCPQVCYPAGTLKEALEIAKLGGGRSPIRYKLMEPRRASFPPVEGPTPLQALVDQYAGQRVMLVGNPGVGRTLFARHLYAALGVPTVAQCREMTAIWSRAGMLSESCPAIESRPFRAPHHTVSKAGMVGQLRRPGEIHLARHGVLFLDEAPEFRLSVLEHVARHYKGSLDVVVLAAHPCPCGWLGSIRRQCACPPVAVAAYASLIQKIATGFGAAIVRLPPVAKETI